MKAWIVFVLIIVAKATVNSWMPDSSLASVGLAITFGLAVLIATPFADSFYTHKGGMVAFGIIWIVLGLVTQLVHAGYGATFALYFFIGLPVSAPAGFMAFEG